MSVLVRLGGAWRTITGAQVFSGGSWRTLVAIQVYSGGAWRQVANFSPPGTGGGGGGTLSLSLSTYSISSSAHNVADQTSSTVTVTPSGGTAPYTYVWSLDSQDGLATYSITTPTAATTSVEASGIPLGSTVGCAISCHVTDSLGATASIGSVSANFTNRSTS